MGDLFFFDPNFRKGDYKNGLGKNITEGTILQKREDWQKENESIFVAYLILYVSLTLNLSIFQQ